MSAAVDGFSLYLSIFLSIYLLLSLSFPLSLSLAHSLSLSLSLSLALYLLLLNSLSPPPTIPTLLSIHKHKYPTMYVAGHGFLKQMSLS